SFRVAIHQKASSKDVATESAEVAVPLKFSSTPRRARQFKLTLMRSTLTLVLLVNWKVVMRFQRLIQIKVIHYRITVTQQMHHLSATHHLLSPQPKLANPPK